MAFPDLFELTDYRRYLRAWFKATKKVEGKRMVKIFADRAGCSGGHVANVIAGRKELTAEFIGGFCRALGLTGADADHFGHMVRVAHPLSDLDRQAAEEALERSRIQRRRRRTPVAATEAGRPDPDLIAWAHPLIAALAACPGFRNDPLWIAEAFSPALGLIQAAALGDLLPSERMVALWEDPEQAVTVATPDSAEGRQAIESALSRARLSWERLPQERREMRISVWAVPVAVVPELLATADSFLPEAIATFTAASRHAKRRSATQFLVEMFPLTPQVQENHR